MAIDSIPGRLFAQARQRPDAPAYHEKTGGRWQAVSWAEYGDQVRRAARALIGLGVEPGDKVCILGFNRPEWVIVDVATIAVGGAPVGVYTTSSPPELQYIAEHSGAVVLLVEDEDQWAKAEAELERMPALRHVVTMRGAPAIAHERVLTWEAFLAHADGVADGAVDERLEGLADDGLATLIYTSGTTGPPKAVMLSQRNLTWTTDEAARLAAVTPADVVVSYLPLSHIAEQLFTVLGASSVGYQVYFAESIAKLPDNLVEVRPTLVFGVPRIWEKMHARIAAKLDAATGFKAALARWATGVGRQVTARRHRGAPLGLVLGLRYRLARRLIFDKVRAAIGFDRVRLCISAAAPISPAVLEFFAGLDIAIHEVYGQSEDTGPTTFSRPGHTRIGWVGTALRGTDVRIADDGEVLLRGPHVFLGYYRDEAATAEALVDGWLHTGDVGELDADGFLRITGRKKEIIVTSGGKNITPLNLERAIDDQPLVDKSVVIGDARPYLTALITLDPERAPAWAAERGVEGDLHAAPALRDELQRHLDGAVNPRLARVERVRRFTVLPRAFTIDDEELTPTLKIKRRVIHARYADEIEAMYGG